MATVSLSTFGEAADGGKPGERRNCGPWKNKLRKRNWKKENGGS